MFAGRSGSHKIVVCILNLYQVNEHFSFVVLWVPMKDFKVDLPVTSRPQRYLQSLNLTNRSKNAAFSWAEFESFSR